MNLHKNLDLTGKDLYTYYNSGNTNVIVDTFTVLNPDSTHAYPINMFTFDILHDTLGYPNKVEQIIKIPLKYNLKQNYPNPFNPSTTIEFNLPKTSEVTLKIFNILGEEVATLVSDGLTAGSYTYEWDAGGLASGVYLYSLSVGSLTGEAGNFIETRKMILMR